MNRTAIALCLLPLGLALPGCSDAERIRDIRETRVRDGDPPQLGASTAERFFRSPVAPAGPGGLHGGAGPSGPEWSYQLPAGWVEKASAQFRDVNLAVPGGVECYVTDLGAGGGTILDNVNRWARQIGQTPLTREQVDGLPRVSLLGGQALLVDLTGAAGGADSRLLGLCPIEEGRAVFVKMIGPAAAVGAQVEAFGQFCASLRRGAASPSAALPNAEESRWAYDLPAGWAENAARQFREVNLEAPGGVECYVTELAGDGGGARANVNRWREQLGQAPLQGEQVDALPRVPLLGGQALLVDLIGPSGSAGAESAEQQARMLGLCLIEDGRAVFVKMVGPEDAVEAQGQGFFAFCASLRREAGAAEAGAAEAPSPSRSSSGLVWTTPAGWRELPGRQFRDPNFEVPGGAECYVTALGGDGGGVEGNANRWRSQFAQPPLGKAEIATLPTVHVLGRESVLCEIDGPYRDMQGVQYSDYAMIGVFCLFPAQALSIKLVGPVGTVRAEKDRFVEFCRSLRM